MNEGGKVLGMPRKMAFWVIGGAVVLVVVMMVLRGRSQPGVAGVPESGGDALANLPGGGAAGSAYKIGRAHV